MPVIIALGEAGWEPVTHASVEPTGVLLERFGPRAGNLYFAVRNPTRGPIKATVTVHAARLKVTAPKRVTRLPDRRTIPVRGDRFQDTLQPGITRAYQVLP